MERTTRIAAEKAVLKITKFAESTREQDPCETKESSSNWSHLKMQVQVPELKKRIPSVWKSQWKKTLAAQGTASCKQIGCNYTCASYESICEHYSQCNFAPQQNFMCKTCNFLADSKDKVENHITECHSDKYLAKDSDLERDKINLSDESIIETDSKQKNRSPRVTQASSDNTRICNRVAFLSRESTQKLHSTEAYKPALHWTMMFESENFGFDLFQDYMPNAFTLLQNDDAVKYLPELTSSMAIKCVNVNFLKDTEDSGNVCGNWKRINRFEGSICGDVPIFFAGGPIWASAWLPIPLSIYAKNPTQYLAISTHPTVGSEYAVGKSYSESNIIQIWDVGQLDHKNDSTNRLPALAYAIVHNSGTVWCLEWCPSGCYQDIDLCNYKPEERKLRRMGLLAAACSDGCVNIYSLPFADELGFERAEYNSWPIYKTDPIATLIVNFSKYNSNKQNWQCNKLSWTREHGHDIIAAGFTNGYIALWDLATTSPLLLNVRKNTRFIDAFQHFFAHHNAVSMIALVPYHGKRYLASASVDRSYKFWDLEETSVPQNCSRKGIIVDGAWMTHWPCSVISFDDALGFNNTHSYIIPLREYGYKYFPILATNAPTYTITVSDYANAIAHGTLAGEVLTIFPHQLLYTEKNLPRKRQLNSFIETIDFLKEQRDTSNENNENRNDRKACEDYHYMPTNYRECEDRFGIIFHDNLMVSKQDVKADKSQDTVCSEKLTSVPVEQCPFTSVNRMTWNPNAWSYLWLMVSYENGLTRLLNFKSMSAPREMEILLSSHTESLLAKINPSSQKL